MGFRVYGRGLWFRGTPSIHPFTTVDDINPALPEGPYTTRIMV